MDGGLGGSSHPWYRLGLASPGPSSQHLLPRQLPLTSVPATHGKLLPGAGADTAGCSARSSEGPSAGRDPPALHTDRRGPQGAWGPASLHGDPQGEPLAGLCQRPETGTAVRLGQSEPGQTRGAPRAITRGPGQLGLRPCPTVGVPTLKPGGLYPGPPGGLPSGPSGDPSASLTRKRNGPTQASSGEPAGTQNAPPTDPPQLWAGSFPVREAVPALWAETRRPPRESHSPPREVAVSQENGSSL